VPCVSRTLNPTPDENVRRWVGKRAIDLDTPALLLDIGALERNLGRMADDCRRLGKALRPHAKAHKSPIVARRQLESGAIGITCAKLGEAAVMLEGGIQNILVSTVVGSPAKARFHASLAAEAAVMAVVDSTNGATWLSDAALAHGIVIDTLVDVNVGQMRTGVEPGLPTRDLARVVAKLPGLRFRGLQGYEGHLQHIYAATERTERGGEAMDRFAAARDALERDGIAVEIATTGGTGTYQIAGARPTVTELQPGSYAVMDADYARVEGAPFEVALTVLATAIGRYGDRVVVDAGNKSLSTDAGQPLLKDLPGFRFTTAGDEHGRILRDGDSPASFPRIGDPVRIVPTHCDTTVNLYDQFFAIRNGVVEDVWPVAARGRTQ